MAFEFEDRSGDVVPEDCQNESLSYFNNEVPHVIVPENYNPELQSPHLSKQSREYSAIWLDDVVNRQRKALSDFVPYSGKQFERVMPNNLPIKLVDELCNIGVIEKKPQVGRGNKNLFRVRPEYMVRFKLFPITMKVASKRVKSAQTS